MPSTISFSEAMSNPQFFSVYQPPILPREKRLQSPYGADAPGYRCFIPTRKGSATGDVGVHCPLRFWDPGVQAGKVKMLLLVSSLQ
jgi:hypothetical protein